MEKFARYNSHILKIINQRSDMINIGLNEILKIYQILWDTNYIVMQRVVNLPQDQWVEKCTEMKSNYIKQNMIYDSESKVRQRAQ